MYPYYGFPPPYPAYGMEYGTSPGTSTSDLRPLTDSDNELPEEKLKYKMGPLLEIIIEDFHRGNEVLKDDSKSKGSLLSLTNKSKKK